MSFSEFFNATAGIGQAYNKGLKEFDTRTALAKLGTQLQGGDYHGAAQTAFAAGDAGTGIGLLKLGETYSKDKRQREYTDRVLNGGGLSDLGGGDNPAGPGLSSLGEPSRALPAFAQAGEGGGVGDYLASTRAKESGGNDLARNPSSTATGRYQFTEGTWDVLARKYPNLGLTPNGRTDPAQQERAMQVFTRDNAQALTSAGIPINPQTLYGAHFLGAPGATRFIRGAANNPDAPALQFADERSVRANRSVFFNRDGSPKTAGEVFAWMGRGRGGGSAPMGRAPVAVAENEADVQALEGRMGMTLQAPQQIASADPRADLPAEGAVPMGYSIPEGQGAVGEEQPAGARSAVSTGSPIFNGDAARLSNPVPGAGGRSMTLPPEAGGAPVQVAQAGGGVPTASGGAFPAARGGNDLMSRLSRMSPGQRVSYLLQISSGDLTESARGPVKQLLENALQESRMPDGVKEFVWARANGMTQARTPAEYAREAKGPQTVAPGTSVLAPDGQSVAFTVPDRDRSKIGDDISARREAALANGLRPGTPQFDNYTLTGKMLNEEQRAPSAADRKAINAAEDELPLIDNTLDTLRRARELNRRTFTGSFSDVRAQVGTRLPDWMVPDVIADPRGAKDTREFGQLMSMEAIKSMSQTLKGATTDREMSRFMEILGDPTTPPDSRERTIDRMITLAERQKQIANDRVTEMRAGTYYQPRGGQSAGAPAGTLALPPPSPSNRPGADRSAAPSAAPAGAVEYLRANPNLRGAFDAKYGAGAAARALGGR